MRGNAEDKVIIPPRHRKVSRRRRGPGIQDIEQMEHVLSQSTCVDHEARKVWRMGKNCAMSPRQFLISYCTLAVVSICVAGLCAASGVWTVLLFAAAELLFIAILFVLYARHAMDYDRIELSSESLFIDCADGPQLKRHEFNPHWTTVRLQSVLNPKIEIRYAGQCLLVGSHVPVHRRALIVAELRRSLRTATAASL
jgi:uncharacterized membrane protein